MAREEGSPMSTQLNKPDGVCFWMFLVWVELTGIRRGLFSQNTYFVEITAAIPILHKVMLPGGCVRCCWCGCLMFVFSMPYPFLHVRGSISQRRVN